MSAKYACCIQIDLKSHFETKKFASSLNNYCSGNKVSHQVLIFDMKRKKLIAFFLWKDSCVTDKIIKDWDCGNRHNILSGISTVEPKHVTYGITNMFVKDWS